MKRALDLIVALAALVVTSPIMVAAALAVAVSSRGPVIFRQERVGRLGKPFKIFKFRSMTVSTSGREVTVAGDERITQIGSWLRASKIDELPQLFNVLRGDMSLVGPRPEVPQYVALWPDQARKEILSVRPGMTDLASIEFRWEERKLAEGGDPEAVYLTEILPRKLELYRNYVSSQSLRTDLNILVRTINAVFRR